MAPNDWKPDPAQGVFETLLAVAGEPVEIEAHLRRLGTSVGDLYGVELPGDADERLRVAAEDLALGRLRLTAIPIRAGSPERIEGASPAAGVELEVRADEIDPTIVFPAAGVHLRGHFLPGGLGAHKWVDRREVGRPAAGEAGALLIDVGEVLEAGWANVFAVRGGALFTPPLDGRLLPGTTRAALLALAAELEVEIHEQPLRPEDLLAADEVFLTGSIRGIEPALALDGEPLPGCGPLSRRLASALRRRWGLASDSDAPRSAAAAPIPDPLAR